MNCNNDNNDFNDVIYVGLFNPTPWEIIQKN